MAQGKQAKTLTVRQETAILKYLETTRHPTRDRAAFLLSIKAGLRAKEISGLTWEMVTGADGEVGDAIHLQNRVSKGQGGGRTIPMNVQLRAMLAQLHHERGEQGRPGRAVIYSERGGGLTANTIAVWFHTLYHTLGLTGCSSHSGRRTFITRAAKKVVEAGGSLRDVQQLAGHASLSMTQRYIEGDTDAKRKLVNMI
jgi:integrase/recombinase XerD